MARLVANDLGKELCDILGLSAEKVSRITLDCSIGGAVFVEVTQYVQKNEFEEIKEVLTRYELIKREGKDG